MSTTPATLEGVALYAHGTGAPPEDVSMPVKVDCARGGIPVVLPAG